MITWVILYTGGDQKEDVLFSGIETVNTGDIFPDFGVVLRIQGVHINFPGLVFGQGLDTGPVIQSLFTGTVVDLSDSALIVDPDGFMSIDNHGNTSLKRRVIKKLRISQKTETFIKRNQIKEKKRSFEENKYVLVLFFSGVWLCFPIKGEDYGMYNWECRIC